MNKDLTPVSDEAAYSKTEDEGVEVKEASVIPVVSLCNEEEEGIVQLPDNNEITAPTFKLLPPISKSRKYQCDTEMEPNGIIADPTKNNKRKSEDGPAKVHHQIIELIKEMDTIRVQKCCANFFTQENLANLFFDYFLPFSQVIAIGQPFLYAVPGAWLSQYSFVGYILIAIIFLVLGLKLKTEDIKDAMRSAHVFIIALISSLFITGSVVAGITGQLPFDPLGQEEKISMLGPYEFRIGLLLYYSVPCTITAGIVLVAQAEGNLPMAGAVATVANIIGCYTTPILLKVFLSGVEAEFDIGGVLLTLTLSILVPVILGKLMQCIPKVPEAVAKVKRWISVVTSSCLAVMLWMKVSKAVEDDAFNGVKWQSLLILIAFVLLMCIINICINTLFSFLLCMRATYIRVMLLMVSQKTLVMAVTLVQVLPDTLGEMGLILVPCFVAHPTQILLFSFIAPQLKKHPFDFRCPKFMPARVIDFCAWMNQNEKCVGDEKECKDEETATVIENSAAVIDSQPHPYSLKVDTPARRRSFVPKDNPKN